MGGLLALLVAVPLSAEVSRLFAPGGASKSRPLEKPVPAEQASL
jgi:hypothetical protein